MKQLLIPILLLALGATTQPSTQPSTQPTAKRNPPGQLTRLVSADVTWVAGATKDNRDGVIDSAKAQLQGMEVYGSVIVDSIAVGGGETIISAHLPWKQPVVITADQQAKIDAAQADVEAVNQKNQQSLAYSSAHANGYGGMSAAKNAAKERAKNSDRVNTKLKTVRDQIAADNANASPNQPVTITTQDPLAANLKPATSYNIKGLVSSVQIDVKDAADAKTPPYVVFTIQVLSVPTVASPNPH